MKALFMHVQIGQKFEKNGDKMIRRRESRHLKIFCAECQKTVGANAILQGVKLDDANYLNFVHICPADYVFLETQSR